jgi:T5SS/PEP-CTERM-associated repeat protein
MRRDCLIAGSLFWIALGIQTSEAQYSADFQTNIISGVTNNWTGYYYIGGVGDVLLVRSNGLLVCSGTGVFGNTFHGSNNSALVTGPGSVWSNAGVLVGESGDRCSVVISNGGHMVSTASSTIGDLSSSNSVLVTGSNSAWYCGSSVVVGNYGVSNRLIISNGGQVTNTIATIGQTSGGHSALVTGSGSVWSNAQLRLFFTGNSLVISNEGQVVVSGSSEIGYLSSNSVRVVDGGAWQNNTLTVGHSGSANSLVIAGGFVTATSAVIGDASTTCDNILELDSGSLVVTNATGTGVLEVRHGGLILNGGLLQADTLVITDPCASFVHTGGTLAVGSVILDPNTFRIVSVARQTNDMLVTWMMGPGATNALQVTAGSADGGYTTNGFKDIFVVTNNTAVGTVTNYLDVGAATNVPSRYYRARLVP